MPDRFIVNLMMPKMEFLLDDKVGYVLDDDGDLGILYLVVNAGSPEQFEKMNVAATKYLIDNGYKQRKLEGDYRKFHGWPGSPEGMLFEKNLKVDLFKTKTFSSPYTLGIRLSVPGRYKYDIIREGEWLKLSEKLKYIFVRPLNENDFKVIGDLVKTLGIEQKK